MAVVRGPQEQSRGVDGARGHHHDLRRVLLALAVAPDDHLVHGAARCSRLQALHEGVGQERDIGVLERGIHRQHLRVGLRPDQAGMAVAGGAADARAAIRALLVELDAERGVERPQARAGEVLGQVLQARLVTHRRVRVWLAGAGVRRVLAALAVHMVHALRARVVRLHLVVRDRPGRRDATVVPQLPEVGFAQAEQRGAVELGVAPHRVVRVRVQVAPVGVLPDLLRLVPAVHVHCPGVPVLLLTADVVAPLEQQDALPGRRESVHQRAPASPGPDHDQVVCVRHAPSSSFVAHGPPLVTRL